MTASSTLFSFHNIYFNSHPHEEDDKHSREIFEIDENFNSHPHEEDDNFHVSSLNFEYISTHILTKRMTIARIRFDNFINISTHILTKRMTAGAIRATTWQEYFNSHPHEEDDPFIAYGKVVKLKFQLTSSRRG